MAQLVQHDIWLLLSALICLGTTLYCIQRLQWQSLLQSNLHQHLMLGGALCIALLWHIRAPAQFALVDLHIVGATSACLVLGPHRAVLVLLLGLFANTLLDQQWQALPSYALCYILLPVAFCHYWRHWVERHLPAHFFIYIFVQCFAGAMLAVLLAHLCMAMLLWSVADTAWAVLGETYLNLLPLLMFPEGFINGMVMTMLVVYKPDWVLSFRDEMYLHGK